MAPPIKSHCKRGHLFAPHNVRLVKLKSGYTVRQCKMCRSMFDRLRYDTDPKRQAAIRARAVVARALGERAGA